MDTTHKKNGRFIILLSTLKMAVATFLSRILGLVREQVVANFFGASGLTDAFTIAFRIPNMLRDLFAEGVFSSAFVPIFTEVRVKNPEKAKGLLWSLFIILILMTGAISTGIYLFAPKLLLLLTDELFTSDPKRLEVAIFLTRVMSPFLVFVSLAALFMGVLNTLKIFFWPALAPACFNIVMILSIVFLTPYLMSRGIEGIYSMGFGVLIGGLVQCLIQVPLIIKNGYGPCGPLEFVTVYTKKIVNRVGIGTIGTAATQINIVITTMLATGTVVGAVSWLNYGFRLFQFPIGIFSVSIAGSNLVHFSDAWKKGESEKAKGFLKTSYDLSLLVIMLCFALLYAMARPSVHLIFERGAFGVKDTLMTAWALKAYLLGLPFYALYKIQGPAFFTLDKPIIPIFISTGSIALNIVFCLYFVPIYGFEVLAIGTSLSMVFNSLLQSVFIKKFLQLPFRFFVDRRLFKILLATLACYGLTNYLTMEYFIYAGTFFEKSIRFILIGSAGLLIYCAALLVMGEGSVLRKVFKR